MAKRSAEPAADRHLPENLEAERSVLGAILMHNDAYETIAGRLEPADFFRAAHGTIFEAMETLLKRPNGTVDMTTLREALQEAGDYEEIGGPAYVAGLVDGVPRSTNIRAYAEIVREKATLRRLIAVGNRAVSEAYDAQRPSDEILSEADRAIVHLQLGSTDGRMLSLSSTASKLMDNLEFRVQHKGQITGVDTGIKRLNDETTGWQGGDLVVIGARPSVGKTAFVLHNAVAAARQVRAAEGSNHVAIFSLEMKRQQLEYRMLSALTGIPLTRLLTGYIWENEWPALSEAISTLADLPIHIDDGTSRTVWDIRTECRQLRSEHGLGCVVIDYVQLMQGDGRKRNATRTEELGAISREVKRLADELNVPIILLSQLSRPDKGAADKEPQISDLRESGALEQDADVVGLLHRKNYREGGLTRFIIAKQRNGPTGTVNMDFDRDVQRFTDWEGEEPPAVEPKSEEQKKADKVAAIIRSKRKKLTTGD